MEFLFAAVAAFAGWVIWRAVRNSDAMSDARPAVGNPALAESPKPASDSPARGKVEINVDLVSTGPTDSKPNLGPLEAIGAGRWILNPKSVFVLTVLTESDIVAHQFKAILDEIWENGPHNAAQQLLPLLAQSNAKVKEVEQYVAEFRPLYRQAIERQKRTSSEWNSASEKDRKDLECQFRARAIEQLTTRPDCDIEVLFDCEPTDATLDDKLIQKYGFDRLQVYMRYANNLGKVHTIAADSPLREAFEDLVKLGLSLRGQNIPMEALLTKMTLKEMTELVSDIEHPPFTRKAKAIEYLLGQASIRDRIGKNVAFRELFQLLPLPSEFSNIDLATLASSWAHSNQVATLLAYTYWNSGWETLNRLRFDDDGYSWIKGWQVREWNQCCPDCSEHSKKIFKRRSDARVPLHIGCNCRVDSVN
jgi:hypothetical protein